MHTECGLHPDSPGIYIFEKLSSYDKKISTFIASDYDKTLFPLETNKFLATQLPEKLHQATERILSGVGGFLSQQRVFAAKPDYLLRRTVKLDPVAEWFVYFMVYKYRDKFKPHPLEHRQWFGYYFKSGIPVPGRESYQEFKTNYRELLQEYKYSLEFDVSQYFNSIYHHDLLTWFQRISNNIEDINAFGSYFREINAGRSLDCLPQGLYPCKMIGNSFLNFVDFNGQIRCAKYIRFMDDFVLFDDDASLLLEDFYLIQTLLGKYGLAVSQYKTVLPFNRKVSETNEKIDDTKIELLRIREILLKDYDAFNRDAEDEIQIDLQPEQRDFLLDLLNNESIEEEDAELVLVLMKDDWERVFDRVVEVVFEFPNLAKNAYNFFQHVEDRNTVAYVLLQEIKTGKTLVNSSYSGWQRCLRIFFLQPNIPDNFYMNYSIIDQQPKFQRQKSLKSKIVFMVFLNYEWNFFEQVGPIG